MQRHKYIFMTVLSRIISGLGNKRLRHKIYDTRVGKQTIQTRQGDGAHYHESWELKIPLKGALHCRFEKLNLNVSQNAVMLIAPKSIHYSTNYTDITRCDRWLNCLFENGDVHLALVKDRGAKDVTHYVLSSDQKSELSILLGSTPNEFCEHIAMVQARPGKINRQMANNWLYLLFSCLLDAITRAASSSPQHELVTRTIALINNMSHDATLTVKRMAVILNVSPKYLSFVFCRLTGVSPRQKLIRIRLERAFRQLQTGKFTVKEVAAFTGWQNQFYFSNSFRRHYGLMPSHVNSRIIPG
jgi:AraC-like DNA-binding protein